MEDPSLVLTRGVALWKPAEHSLNFACRHNGLCASALAGPAALVRRLPFIVSGRSETSDSRKERRWSGGGMTSRKVIVGLERRVGNRHRNSLRFDIGPIFSALPAGSGAGA